MYTARMQLKQLFLVWSVVGMGAWGMSELGDVKPRGQIRLTGSGEEKTIAALIASEPKYAEFYKLLAKFPKKLEMLGSTTGGDYTVLIPGNAAFSKVFVRSKDLEGVLDYHIISGRKTGTILGGIQASGQHALYPTHVSSRNLKGRLQMIGVFYCPWLDGYLVGHSGRLAEIEGPERKAQNGLVYEISKVLLPPRSLIPTLESVDRCIARGSLSTFVTGLEIAGLASGPNFIQQMSGITVFAPTNAAWDRLGGRFQRYLMSPAGAKVLESILRYHISPSRIAYSISIGQGYYSMETLLHEKVLGITQRGLRYESDVSGLYRHPQVGEIMINHRARIIESDVLIANGVVHVIDQVLLPCEASLEKVMEEGEFHC